MPTDNVDVFKKIVFSIPSLEKVIALILISGGLYAGLFYFFLSNFTSFPLDPGLVPVFALLLFIAPVMVSSEIFHWILPDYPRRWGYFLGLVNELFLFAYLAILTGADNLVNAWHLLWLGLITVYLTSVLVLLSSLGKGHLKKILAGSLVHPLMVLAGVNYLTREVLTIPLFAYLESFAIMVVAAAVLYTTLKLLDYLIGSNLENVSGFQLTSGILQKSQEALELGYSARPEVQTLAIENQAGETVVAVPWIHPGPLEGFGGGKVTSRIIEHLNSSGEGFFFHVPSSHMSDLADPDDVDRIIDALGEPEKSSRASKLVKKEYEDVNFYGRRFDGKKMVFMENLTYHDDYEMPIFREVVDHEDVILADLHNHLDEGRRETLNYNTERAEELRSFYQDFLEHLEEQPLEEYSAGTATGLDGHPVFALNEEVGSQSTMIFGVEGNGVTRELMELEEELSEEFDEVLFFSTDTHASVHQLARETAPGKEDVREVVLDAVEELSPARIGMVSRRSETVKLLQEDYLSLIFSINILIRLAPITLILLYAALIIMVF
ncbi:MAG: DUF2070 family protein [Candidatus Nanohaloarchaea archaeon]